MLMLFCGSCVFSFAQSSPSSSTFHHWHSLNPDVKLGSSVESEYKKLPESDYTPRQNVAEWSAGEKIKSFASGLSGRLSALYILGVDETGIVRKIKTLKTSDAKSSAAFAAIIMNTKVSGPAFLHNQAVACYMPCSVSIDKNQINIK